MCKVCKTSSVAGAIFKSCPCGCGGMIPVDSVVTAQKVAKVNPRRNAEREEAFVEMGAYLAEAKKSDTLELEFKRYRKVLTIARVCKCTYIPELGAYGVGNPKYGIATCSKDDKFNRVIGEYLALKYALKESIPESVAKVIHGVKA